MSLQNDLTQGSVQTHILRFSMPLLLSNLFQALYNAVDMYFAGKFLGTAGLVAVGVSGPVMNVLFMTIAGMSVGVSVAIGSHMGQGDTQAVKKSAGTAISLYALCALCMMLLGFVMAPGILKIISTPEEAYAMAVAYLRIVMLGMPFTLGYNLICAFQRGFGDSRSSLLFVVVATCANALLNVVFVRDLGMGVQGSALATVVSQALSLLLGIVYFHRRKHIISFAPSAWRWSKQHLNELIRIGLPSALQQALVTISHLTLSGIVNTYGLAVSAAYGIGVKLDSFAILPCTALSDAVAAFTSQNLGAGQEERALNSIRAARRMTVAINIPITILILLFAPNLARLFNTDPNIVSLTAHYLRITGYMYILHALVHPTVGFVKGSGNAMFSLTNVLQSHYLVRIPLALLLSKALGLGFTGIAIAWLTSPLYSNFTYAHFLKSGRWKKRLERSRAQGNAV